MILYTPTPKSDPNRDTYRQHKLMPSSQGTTPKRTPSNPCPPMETHGVMSLLRQMSSDKRSKSLFGMFKLFPQLSSGCKMATLLGRPRKALLTNKATIGTLFGYRKGRLSLAIQEDPRCVPMFVIELPILTSAFHKEMATGLVRIALESETKTSKKKLLEEFVWAVYCNGRKTGYSIRRKVRSEDELHVMQHLRGVSMGAGVLPCPSEKESADGELTYMRARFERVVGSKDSEALYMINPGGCTDGPELSIFFVRVQ
ncbi:PREDICTED: protein MIZU-KUSSEI 1-like [Nelumbo nucifera]|uniref:Protein MIZU-KUSSEI 1-like n=1 Tax=Nelumbo nucifera TaxID=4432 RepID=A0A1U8AQZ0_NELNU|nr:PREDICTED: protein MIZU-KUSSEI 1-like [Nelumbo nucifera]